MTKSEKDGLACIGLLVAVPVSILLTAIMVGGTGTTLYNWFVVPAFRVRPITPPLVLGLYLMVSLCKSLEAPAGNNQGDDKDRSARLDGLLDHTLAVAWKCALALIIGRICIAFM